MTSGQRKKSSLQQHLKTHPFLVTFCYASVHKALQRFFLCIFWFSPALVLLCFTQGKGVGTTQTLSLQFIIFLSEPVHILQNPSHPFWYTLERQIPLGHPYLEPFGAHQVSCFSSDLGFCCLKREIGSSADNGFKFLALGRRGHS